MTRLVLTSLLIFSSCAHAEAPAAAQATTLTVFAAASLKNALDAAAEIYKAQTGVAAQISYAASFTLAKQIEAGAPADVFFAADTASMDYLAERRLIDPATRVDLLGNMLVVVAPASAPLTRLALTPGAFAAALGDRRLAMGDPASVPAGKYAQAAFESLKLWSEVQPRAAFADNVRAALNFVARDEAPLGVVYATDAQAERKVKVVAAFAADTHPEIVYPLAATTRGAEAAGGFLKFLRSPAARATFETQGFSVLAR